MLEINEFRCYEATPNGVLTAHTEWLPDVRLRHSVPSVQYTWRIVRVGGRPAVVAQWQSSGRALAAQARGVLGSTPGNCRLFHFPLFSPHNI